MFLKSQLLWTVIIPPKNLELGGLALHKAIIVPLMDDFTEKKASRGLGYHLAVISLDKIGEGKVIDRSGDVLFPAEFSCLTFKMFKGEILKHGIFLRCGPMEKIYLSHKKMPDFQYVHGENPFFMGSESRITKEVSGRLLEPLCASLFHSRLHKQQRSFPIWSLEPKGNR